MNVGNINQNKVGQINYQRNDLTMNKKGDNKVIMIIFELLVVVVIIFGVLMLINRYAHSTSVQRIAVADDLWMMVNVFAGIPGDASVEHPSNTKDFIFHLTDSKLFIAVDQDELESMQETRTYHLPQGYTVTGFLVNPERICLEKKGKTIILNECEQNEP